MVLTGTKYWIRTDVKYENNVFLDLNWDGFFKKKNPDRLLYFVCCMTCTAKIGRMPHIVLLSVFRCVCVGWVYGAYMYRIMYELEWRTAYALTRGLLWCTTRGIHTKITIECAHKQCITRVHTLSWHNDDVTIDCRWRQNDQTIVARSR